MSQNNLSESALLDELELATTHEEMAEQSLEVSLKKMEDTLAIVKQSLLLKKQELDSIAVTELEPIKGISNDVELKSVRKVLASAGKSIKEVAEMRLNTTRPIDGFKKELIEVERTICADLQEEQDRVKKIADEYEIREAKRRKEEQERIQRQLEVNIETERILNALKSEAQIKFDQFVNKAEEQLRNGFAGLTLANFEEKTRLLNSFKPLLKQEAYDSLFSVSYNTSIISANVYAAQQLIAKDHLSFNLFTEQYSQRITPVVEELKSKIPAKKAELDELAELQAKNAEAAKQRLADLERKENEEREKRMAEARAEEERKKQRASEAAEDAKLQTQLNAQKDLQSSGPVTVKKSLMKATVLVPSAYQGLLQHYLVTGGDTSKLEFLADFAAKNGQPKISGVSYNV